MLRQLSLLCKPKSSAMTAGLSFYFFIIYFFPSREYCSDGTRAHKKAYTFLNTLFGKFLTHCDYSYKSALLMAMGWMMRKYFSCIA